MSQNFSMNSAFDSFSAFLGLFLNGSYFLLLQKNLNINKYKALMLYTEIVKYKWKHMLHFLLTSVEVLLPTDFLRRTCVITAEITMHDIFTRYLPSWLNSHSLYQISTIWLISCSGHLPLTKGFKTSLAKRSTFLRENHDVCVIITKWEILHL